MVSSSIPITPRKFRSDLYSSYQEDSNIPLVIYVVASLLERTIAKNERIATKCSRSLSMDSRSLAAFEFDCYEAPNMEIQSFLERISRYTGVGPPVYVVAYVYIDRLCQIHPEFRITSTNVHRLLITTIMVASKFVEDMNSYFAKVGGLTTNQMNKLEVDFLFLVGFKLHVNVSVFKSYCCHLEREVSVGGGYQIESTLKSLWTEAEEIKSISSKGRK
ncbi:PREDICTED: cyclin-U2-2-like isoform X2 [Nelumbo nucifera]|uniref:Cyclin n=1 Tax=Nelumbo nucifera TaxID=4432 RepID=A0A1U8AP23_NELNU|nr:PREDICTED: cyclin-U2-2-like isoform X2 [Nelumbo nucifera]